ncbi:MAG: bacterial Ig-like domain-containing protein [Eubacteriales bacterium]
MKKKSLRIVSALLSFVMVFLLIPFGAITVTAQSITSIDKMGKLGYGFNMLGDDYLSSSSVRLPIFTSMNGINADFASDSYTTTNFTYISSMSSYIENGSKKWNVSLDANVCMKLIALDIKGKFGMAETTSSSDSEHSEMAIIQVLSRRGKYEMVMGEAQIKRLWNKDGNDNYTTLNEDFVEALLTYSPEEFFALYGTHIITAYSAGGEAYASYQGRDLASTSSSSNEWGVDATVQLSTRVALDAKAGFDFATSSGNGDSTSSTVKQTSTKVTGGTGFSLENILSGGEDVINDWLSSLNEDTIQILSDDTLKLLPVWELLYQDEYEDRRTELEEYFIENVNADYIEFYNNYIYNPAGVVDYNGYTFIQTAEDFANIANDLGGKYVLLNNIDLGGVEWSPIGTVENPFRGIVDGNGNTVSGLTITKTTNGVAGLFGYNNGTIRNLTVSGGINADASGSTDNIAYIGGIAGYNAGVIDTCRNMVTIKGMMTTSDEDIIESEETANSFFKEHATAIEKAKTVSIQTISNNSTISAGLSPVHLTGNASGVTIQITGSSSNEPAYIVLDNANISGKITHTSNRIVCIISIGDSNSITGPADSIALNVNNGTLYITGDAPLSVLGGKGSTGLVGENGKDGMCGVNATALHIDNTIVTITGGDGGTGGIGVDGKIGSSGGKGGNGGKGSKPISVSTVTINDGTLYLKYGDGGTGGKGGTGGTGTTGSNGKNASKGGFLGAGYYYGTDGGAGGIGGAGGNGGNGGESESIDISIEQNVVTGINGRIFYIAGEIGKGGDGGSGGIGGTGGVGGSCDGVQTGNGCGKGCTCGGNGGAGGQGGTGGVGGNGSVPGAAGIGGEGGAGGIHSTELKVCSCRHNGSKGATGPNGASGGVLNVSDTNKNALSISKYRYYSLYANKYYTWEEASVGKNLVSIGSKQEQELIEQMLEAAQKTDGVFWIGLNILSYDADTQTSICEWADGSKIKIVGNGSSAVAYRIDNEGNVIGNAFINFDNGEPNNAANQEFYVHLNIGGKWNDNSAGALCGYITETDIGTSFLSTIEKNSAFAGGISGYNIGSIKNSYNNAKISLYKVYSEKSSVSSYSGGVSGYNEGIIDTAVNEGTVVSFSMCDSMSHFAEAYAETISTNSIIGVLSNYSGIKDVTAIAVSANALHNEHTSSSLSAGTDATTTIKNYWQSSELIINYVNKTEYIVAQEFDEASLNLNYNGSTITNYSVRYNFYQPGTSTATVVYENGGNRFVRYIPVYIAPATPVSIELYGIPKVEFIFGDEFTYMGLSVKLNYNNDTYKLISSKNINITVSEPNMSLIGEQQVNVSYTPDGGVTYLTCDYPINISAVAMTSLQIARTPDKTTYWQGEALDTTGLVVQKVMNNGTTEEIALGNTALTINYDFSSVGTQTVTITYNDFNATFDCIVKAVEVTGIDIIQEPYKTTYVEGATLNTDGLKVQTVLSNGEVATITGDSSDLSYIYDFSTEGVKTVTVKYGNYTDSFTCEVYTYEDYLKTVTKVTVESVKGCAGNTVTVDIVLDNNAGILAAALSISYNSALTLIDAQVGEALSSLTLTKPGSFDSPCTFAWDGINDADATNGTILTLTFIISEEAVTGDTYEISVSYTEGNVIDGAFENIEVATINGGITVIDYIPGDLSGDGVVNMADVVTLRRYIVGGYDLNINLDAADVNNDGSINMADVVLIRRYVVGGYGVVLQ